MTLTNDCECESGGESASGASADGQVPLGRVGRVRDIAAIFDTASGGGGGGTQTLGRGSRNRPRVRPPQPPTSAPRPAPRLSQTLPRPPKPPRPPVRAPSPPPTGAEAGLYSSYTTAAPDPSRTSSSPKPPPTSSLPLARPPSFRRTSPQPASESGRPSPSLHLPPPPSLPPPPPPPSAPPAVPSEPSGGPSERVEATIRAAGTSVSITTCAGSRATRRYRSPAPGPAGPLTRYAKRRSQRLRQKSTSTPNLPEARPSPSASTAHRNSEDVTNQRAWEISGISGLSGSRETQESSVELPSEDYDSSGPKSLLDECLRELPDDYFPFHPRLGHPDAASTPKGPGHPASLLSRDAGDSTGPPDLLGDSRGVSAESKDHSEPAEVSDMPLGPRPLPPPKPAHLMTASSMERTASLPSVGVAPRSPSPDYAEYDHEEDGDLHHDLVYEAIPELPQASKVSSSAVGAESWETTSEASTSAMAGPEGAAAQDGVAKRKRLRTKNLTRKLRPISAISQPNMAEAKEGLLRLSTDIRHNLAKQVGRMKLRVSQASGDVADEEAERGRLGLRKAKSRSTFYPDPASVDAHLRLSAGEPGQGSASDEDEDLWGFSDEEDEEVDEEGLAHGYGETEEDLSMAVHSSSLREDLTDWASLPDVVVSSSRGGTLKAQPPAASPEPQLSPEANVDEPEAPKEEPELAQSLPETSPPLIMEPEVTELPKEATVLAKETTEKDASFPAYPKAFLESRENIYNCISSPEAECKVLPGEDGDTSGDSGAELPEDREGTLKPGTLPIGPGAGGETELGSPELTALEPSYCSRLSAQQPLYQHYQADRSRAALTLARNASLSSASTSEEGAASSVASSLSAASTTRDGGEPNLERRRRLVGHKGFGSQRSLWCEMPEVKRAGILESLGDEARKLQEANFEVLTSEASYLRSLNFLITHFMAAPELLGKEGTRASVISRQERKHLFSNIIAVRDCSERLLLELEDRWEAGVLLEGVATLLATAFDRDFSAYVSYCSNQVYQDRALKFLKKSKPAFARVLEGLEAAGACEGLNMRSFLMLPMQRVTRYPLLIDAILQRTPKDQQPQALTAKRALALAHKVVRRCNDGARRMERTEQLIDIEARLRYRHSEVRRLPLVSPTRYLLKHGALCQLLAKDDGIGRSLRRSSLGALAAAAYETTARRRTRPTYLFLFTDLILVAKPPKASGEIVVRDYCARQFAEIAPLEAGSSAVPSGALASLSASLGPGRRPFLFLLTLMANSREKQASLVLCAESESERARWVEALTRPSEADGRGGSVYADWDCPQVQATHAYEATQPDELALEEGDVAKVLRKMPDGWFEGERLRDGARGWFPGSYVLEILSDHVRAKNYRQRLRLIQAAESVQLDQRSKASLTGSPASPLNSPQTPQPQRLSDKLPDPLRRLSQPFFPS